MDNDSQIIIDLWDSVKNHITTKQKYDAAVKFLDAIQEYYDIDINEIYGSDIYLDKALAFIFELNDNNEE